ncbi:hypothetical protein PV10_05102 [Exophiala mesophila]|uniref:Transcription factor domain-containing protein n=1 Tax=Exophiala mesophila TaxID=212818 RepID=A0A0D2A4N1_EXOME|nr:uncharacterized protein PV10_05102 [Exophiala mesophila]KIV93928.1 hypothetical protein PV10_05102 [Exophiala mesophila]
METPSLMRLATVQVPTAEQLDTVNGLDESTVNAIWAHFVPIKTGVLNKQDVQEYLSFYFRTLWHFKPVIPRHYRDRSKDVLLIDREPLLTITLLVLASRWHPLAGPHGEIRSERIHWQLWKYLQTYLNTVLWGSNCTRSLGTIASLLLVIEWHSKATNNLSQLCEDLEDGVTRRPRAGLRGIEQTTKLPSAGQHSYEAASALERLNILSAAHRSSKMSWTLLSVAISLAHEGRCFENPLQHKSSACSETEKAEQEWTKLLCVFLFMADENLALRLGREPLLSESARQTVMTRLSASFASCLDDSFIWESTLELYIEHRKARQSIQALATGRPGSEYESPNVLPTLEHIQRNLARWRRRHKTGIEGSSSTLHHLLDIEYRYSLLYSFSPALAFWRHHEANRHPQDQATGGNAHLYSQFAHVTKQASQELLSIVVYSLEPLNLLRYAPVRFWAYIIPTSLYLIKASLILPTRPGEILENTKLLHALVGAAKRSSPDDLHISVSFSQSLEALLRVTLDLCPDDSSTGLPQTGQQSGNTIPSSSSLGEDENANLLMFNQFQALERMDFGSFDFLGNSEAWFAASDLIWPES